MLSPVASTITQCIIREKGTTMIKFLIGVIIGMIIDMVITYEDHKGEFKDD